MLCLSCEEALVGRAAIFEHNRLHHHGRYSHVCPQPGCSQRFDMNYLVQEHVVGHHNWKMHQLVPSERHLSASRIMKIRANLRDILSQQS